MKWSLASRRPCLPSPGNFLFSTLVREPQATVTQGFPGTTLVLRLFCYPNSWPFIALKLFSFSTLQQPSAVWGEFTRKCLFFINSSLSIRANRKTEGQGRKGSCSIRLIKLPASRLCPALRNSPQLTQEKPCDLSKPHWFIDSGLLKFSGCTKCSYWYV